MKVDHHASPGTCGGTERGSRGSRLHGIGAPTGDDERAKGTD